MSVYSMKRQFCETVYKLRTESGLSLPELSRRSGLPLTMLEELERGVLPKRMMVDDAWKLAEAFGCEAAELFR